jgi:hypothetical protein
MCLLAVNYQLQSVNLLANWYFLKEIRRVTMSKLNLTPEEETKVLEILERYLPELEHETVHTESKELRKFFMERKAFMQELMRRLKS